ncbi:MAG: hypothetical protein ACOY46_01950 [Bacillota bacterium]
MLTNNRIGIKLDKLFILSFAAMAVSIILLFAALKIEGILLGNINLITLKLASLFMAIISLVPAFFVKNKKNILSFSLSFLWTLTLIFLSIKSFLPPPADYSERLLQLSLHEAGHAIVTEELAPGSIQEIRIIEPWRSRWFKLFNIEASGYVRSTPLLGKDPTLDNARKEICMALAGLASIDVLMPDVKYGSNRKDTQKVEDIVRKIIDNGISDAGPYTWNMLTENQRCEISQKIVSEEYERAKTIIVQNKENVEALAQQLREKYYLSGQEAIQIINR